MLDERIHKGKKEYLVKWKGFTEMDNSWVKESNMNAPEAIEEFKIRKYNKTTEKQIPINNMELQNDSNFLWKISKFIKIFLFLF